MKPYWAMCLLLYFFSAGCTKTDNGAFSDAKLILRYRFDSTQQRLDNTGMPSAIKDGNAALSPVLNSMSVNHIELMPETTTAFGKGVVLFQAPETSVAGDNAIDFSQSITAGNYEVFFAVSLKDIPPGEYEWLRIAPAYQQFSVTCHLDTVITITTDTSSQDISIAEDFPATVAGFTGYNTYINSYLLKTVGVEVEGNRKQGYWGFEATYEAEGINETDTISGQIPEGSITVVNPLFNSSPVPDGSSAITASFLPGKLVITGKEKENVIVEVSFSTNHSFEWQEILPNGKWDAWKGEPLVDIGFRGMIPVIK